MKNIKYYNIQNIIDKVLTQGYEKITSISNLVFLSKDRSHILKIACPELERYLDYKIADFKKCLTISDKYSKYNFMPVVYEYGESYEGSPFPYMKEEHVEGQNFNFEYIDNPDKWDERLPYELNNMLSLYEKCGTEIVQSNIKEKLDWIVAPEGCSDFADEVIKSGNALMKMNPEGYVLHGDLQLGNLLYSEKKDKVYMIDWEASENMNLGYELAFFYSYIIDPNIGVEEELRGKYNKILPLKKLWLNTWKVLSDSLQISAEEFSLSVKFRKANAWLYTIKHLSEEGNKDTEIKYWEQRIEDLLTGNYFNMMPV